jgi:uncharacterized delta-60 repeat protein
MTVPEQSWSLGRFDRSSGGVVVASDSQQGGTLRKSIQVGPATFDFQPPFPYSSFLPPDKASGALFGSADGAQSSVLAQAPPNPGAFGKPDGTFSELDTYQSYVKLTRKASLQITLSDLLLRTFDTGGQPGLAECPRADCVRVKSFASFQAHAYPLSGGTAGGTGFFDVGGAVYLEGHQHSWRQDPSTLTGSTRGLWGPAQFSTDLDADHSHTGASAVKRLNGPITINVPLASVHRGQLFAVHVSLEAQAVDDRGDESGAQAFFQDPQHVGPALRARGLEPRGAPRSKEPPVRARPAALCPAGLPRRAGTVQLKYPAFTVGEEGKTPMVLVSRTGGSRGATSVVVTTTGGTARSGVDFKPTRTLVRFENGDTSPRLVEIPIREDLTRESPESFRVSLAHVRCSTLGKQRSATVTILDDDQPPPPPPPTFTIGGTVDGLQGSGLVLSNLGGQVRVSANGNFTFPGTATIGQGYEVNVAAQPHSPEQVCTVAHGTGQVSNANVTDIAVHCQTPAIPSGLDLSFGDAGRVSTPVGGDGQGEGVVIQPDGKIVTAGWHSVGVVKTGIATDFALTRHNSDGTLDTSFGTGGIATTDLGPSDQANDAALLPDGGIIAVGSTDAAGVLNSDFALVRYNPDGTPNRTFDTDGIVTTDFFGKGDQANAVAVQSDGKIVVAGNATHAAGIDSDFALARYNPDGTLDSSFDGDGILTTDLGTESDDARAIVIQPDGRIVVAGSAGENIVLARYAPDGKLDTTFGTGGTKITDLGFDDVATGVALTPDGKIVISGYTIGAKLNNDFLVARYDSNGTLDTTFGSGGIVKTDFGDGDDFAENLTVDARGRIILVGRATSPTILDMALVRYNPDGSLDTSFAANGILTADFHGRGEFGQDVALDSAGRIVAVGYTANSGGTEFALMRANP